MSDNPRSRDHILKLMIAAELQVGLSKVQAKYEISKCAAALKTMTDGLFFDGAISKEEYELFNQRYKRKLVDIAKEGRENSHIPKFDLEKQKREKLQAAFCPPKPLAPEEIVNNTLKGMLEQWEDHRDIGWRIRTIAYAKKHSENEFAKLIVAKEKCDNISPSKSEGESAI